jgi:queuine tRNA-ribosyltransferase subunit QTRTD1
MDGRCRTNKAILVIEKVPPRDPPIFAIPPLPNVSRLRRFTAQPSDTLLILGPRRPNPVDAPMTNSNDAFTIYTSVGFRRETIDEYITAASTIGPDVLIGPADIVWATTKSQKRIEKMADRTERWMDKVFQANVPAAVFAPLLPVPAEQQRMYLAELVENKGKVAGLAIYDPVALLGMPEPLSHLVRLSQSPPASPHDILRLITLGVDIFTIPFIAEASDAGIALTFTFPPASKMDTHEPALLGMDLFPADHAMSTSPIDEHCTCYTCRTSSRAYIQHLLSAKEMTGWVLLQIHNHAVMHTFFTAVRQSIERGTFDEDVASFEAFYTPELPSQSGAGPRVRGYQYRSQGPNEKKRNPRAFRSNLGADIAGLGTEGAIVEALSESVTVDDVSTVTELEKHGLGQATV